MLRIAVSLLPVFMFLAALIVLDTFKLLRLKSVLMAIAAGCLAASFCFLVNNLMIGVFGVETTIYSRYIAPIIEEGLKASYIIVLLRSKKIGFMVDSAIYGFAVGAGFAFIENIYYLQAIANTNLLLWIIRGLGTAMMHGGATAMFGIIASKSSDRSLSVNPIGALLGLCLAAIVHSLYNHFFLTPVVSTVVLLVVLPVMIIEVFKRSEKATREWLGLGLDTDLQLLDLIIAGNVSETKIGKYFQTLHDRFPGEVIADMLCLIRLHVELSIRAKGLLLMRSAGFDPPPEPMVKEKFAELKYLEKTIGRMGLLAISPLLHTTSRDLWQIYMLGAH